MIFKHTINGWSSWAAVFQSLDAFALLAEHILQKENLPVYPIVNTTPGTNAVFRAGTVILKIFAPPESGFYTNEDFTTELFGLRRANALNIPAPKLLAHGAVEDKYLFRYMVMEYVEGEELGRALQGMSCTAKFNTGQKLRAITDLLNTPCEQVNQTDILSAMYTQRRWESYSKAFQQDRHAFLKSHIFGPLVYVHGDLNGDNILRPENGELYILDFADALKAPVSYEQALVAVELFQLDRDALAGYFGSLSIGEITDICLEGLLIHDFGGDILKHRLNGADTGSSVTELREEIFKAINEFKS